LATVEVVGLETLNKWGATRWSGPSVSCPVIMVHHPPPSDRWGCGPSTRMPGICRICSWRLAVKNGTIDFL